MEAYLPPSLPLHPPVKLEALSFKLERENLVLGRLDGVATILPDTPIFLHIYVRQEALFSSQIERAQLSFSDLLLFEIDSTLGIPL